VANAASRMFQADDELIVRFAARRNLLTNQESVSDTLFAACVIDAKGTCAVSAHATGPAVLQQNKGSERKACGDEYGHRNCRPPFYK
jgi:hypothetical protein